MTAGLSPSWTSRATGLADDHAARYGNMLLDHRETPGGGSRAPTGRRAGDLQLHRLPRADDGRGDGRQDQHHGRHEGADCSVGPVEAVVRGLRGDGLGDDRR